MIYYEQVKGANVKAMGKQKGWCLQNVRLAFGIPVGKFASAKADMDSQRKNGTLHPINTLPENVSVPVYIDTPSKYEHVVLSVNGVFYEDGKMIGRNKYSTFFGWGECCDGVRVVKQTTLKTFLPAKGYWAFGDNDERVGFLADFMYATFPKYTSRKALGNYYGKNIKASITEFQRRTGLYPDGCVGKITYAKLKEYGFKY